MSVQNPLFKKGDSEIKSESDMNSLTGSSLSSSYVTSTISNDENQSNVSKQYLYI